MPCGANTIGDCYIEKLRFDLLSNLAIYTYAVFNVRDGDFFFS